MVGPTGQMQYLGAEIAAGTINAMGGVVINGTVCNITVETVNTNEAADPSGETGYTNLLAKIGDFDIMMGGFRTEAITYYRGVAIDAHKIFFDAGAATETLCHAVVDNYARYKYFFKSTPYNEYFLAAGVLKMLGSVARVYRTTMNMSVDQNLTALEIGEDLAWSKTELMGKIQAGLPALHINLLAAPVSVDAVNTAPCTSQMTAWHAANATKDPNFIIPIFSGAVGVTFSGLRAAYFPYAMAVGINVADQFMSTYKNPPIGNNLTDPLSPPYCYSEVLLDTWADGVNQTSKTAGFLAAMMSLAHDYPLYTAVTYDQLFTLKACLQAVGTTSGGLPQAKADDIIAWLENPANGQLTTTGAKVELYPMPGTTSGGKPALNSTQVSALYNITSYGYTYNAADWVVPYHTAHDLVYGPGSATGIGAQWQYAAGQWRKVGVWPRVEAGTLTDQYGNWNFAYPGTVSIWIPTGVVTHWYVTG
jgi:hypothetical protein